MLFRQATSISSSLLLLSRFVRSALGGDQSVLLLDGVIVTPHVRAPNLKIGQGTKAGIVSPR